MGLDVSQSRGGGSNSRWAYAHLSRHVFGLVGRAAVGGVAVLVPFQALRREEVAHVAVALVAEVAVSSATAPAAAVAGGDGGGVCGGSGLGG